MKLIDTSAWVEVLRRRGDPGVKQAVANLIQKVEAAYTCPVRFELLIGRRDEEDAELHRVLAQCHHLRFGPEDWRDAANMGRRLKDEGITVPRNDLYVAAAALRAGLTVVCRDVHFALMADVFGEDLHVEQL